ncbi:trimeric intracellular cation channel family protein [Luteimonas abyssi]|uniref:trimeric intracellular cation channel family protein n=1 Tax=Luteimonas abyssi TaxID=1247514 RepID=UPI000737C2AE|nr:trimeric intracellular cation channel family protein [Luteimonas abyssi]
MDTFLLALDFIGTFAFAISGATIGVRHRLDLFGVLVLAFATATFGGILRDLLIGAVPPAALTTWTYLALACVAGLATFYRHALVERLRNPVQLFDAAGLALFAVSGASKALAFGLSPFAAVLLGMLSGIGGGIARDILVARTPVVLQADLYAVAALAAAAVVVAGHQWGVPEPWSLVTGAGLCFGLRYMAIRHGWRLPVARPHDAP